jgi:hypothetical protein
MCIHWHIVWQAYVQPNTLFRTSGENYRHPAWLRDFPKIQRTVVCKNTNDLISTGHSVLAWHFPLAAALNLQVGTVRIFAVFGLLKQLLDAPKLMPMGHTTWSHPSFCPVPPCLLST